MTEVISGVLAAALNAKVVQDAFDIARSNRAGVLSVVSEGPARVPYDGYKGSWLDMRVDADGALTTATLAPAATTIAVDDGTVYRKGMTVSVDGEDEIILVTGVSGNTLTIVRQFGSTPVASVTHPIGTKLTIDTVGREENSTAQTDNIKQPDTVENYFQTFDTAIEFSRRALATLQFGNTNDMAFQISERIRQLTIDMDRALMRGRRATATIDSKLHTYTGGMRFYTDQTGAIKVDASAAPLTIDLINDVNEVIASSGGRSNTIAVSVAKARKLSAAIAANYSSSRLADWTADEGSALILPSDLPLVGSVNQIVVDTNISDDELFIFDSSMISIVPMAAGNASNSGNWRSEDATAKGQDGEVVRVIGDYMMQLRNSKTHLARLHNIG